MTANGKQFVSDLNYMNAEFFVLVEADHAACFHAKVIHIDDWFSI